MKPDIKTITTIKRTAIITLDDLAKLVGFNIGNVYAEGHYINDCDSGYTHIDGVRIEEVVVSGDV